MSDSSDRQMLADPTAARSNCGVGVVADLDGGPSHDVLADAIRLLENLEHRGTTGAEPNTGDGAGVMVERPDGLFRAVVDDLPERYAVGSLFLPRDESDRALAKAILERELAAQSVELVAWRSVPTDAARAELGATARESEPHVAQVFLTPTDEPSDEAFDRRLYVARRGAETAFRDRGLEPETCYVCSLDRKRVVYKGLLKGSQLADYYPDLRDERLETGTALVHARFSTNTLGAWHLAHPYRNVIHNGEFNTLRGNVNWMRARESRLSHPGFSEPELETVRPVVSDPDQSDTACLDETLDLLLQGGRELPHALRMLIPEAFRGDESMSDERRAFYDYHASLVEPWDGPALVIGFDGDQLAGVLDRNGLRPCRYDVTRDGRLVMASEVGALDMEPSEVAERGRLAPGEAFVVDTDEGRVVPDEEVFAELTDDRYAEWVDDNQRSLEQLVDETAGDGGRSTTADAETTDAETADAETTDAETTDAETAGAETTDAETADAETTDTTAGEVVEVSDDLRARQAAFGYTTDQLDELLGPMAETGSDPVGSMGDDTPLSVLSSFNRSLFTYFKQLFAQVSNPPIDYIREELVTSLETRLGPQRNLLAETPAHARQVVADSPVFTDRETQTVKELDAATDDAFSSVTLDTTYEQNGSLESAVADLRERAVRAVRDGADVIVLSDRAVGPDRVPIPSLLATGGVHHHLVREGLRADAGLVVESGDPCEVHHVACLIGYGAGAVNPYLAYETIRDLVAGPDGADPDRAVGAYVEALEEGVLKTMAKMGISTMESYQGAQIFEAVGLDSALVAEYFTGTEIRTEGIGLSEIESDLRARHRAGFEADEPELQTHGEYQNRSTGIRHGWNPQTVRSLQQAVRNDDRESYEEFAELVNDATTQTLRGLLTFDTDDRQSVPTESVEPVEAMHDRFATAAMSLGSLSPEAHENNARAMNRIGSKANTGEGGEPPERFGTERECAIKQVASGRFGVTAEYLSAAEEIQIKMAQGSKPGEGGHLPGRKVNEMIAHVRYATPGVGLISPPPQHDIYSIEDLKQLIHDLRAANPDATINVKLVSEAGIGTIAAGVAKAGADVIHVSGHSGGTGASPKTSIKNAGLPWELGLAEANQTLCATGLRDRVQLTVDGGLRTGRDAAIAAALGAEEFVFGTASLVSSGCVMARQCHENTCPVGVATQKEELRNRFPGEPEHVINYVEFMAAELREILAELGLQSVDELVGRPDLLVQRESDHPKASKLDLSAVLAEPAGDVRRKRREQDGLPADRLDDELIAASESARTGGRRVQVTSEIDNTDRAVGATLSNRMLSADGGVDVTFEGTAGQSFGAFLADGVDARLAGAANDYVGKGLSGGRLVVRTPADAGYDPAETVVVGNVALYGATQGELYVNGRAGERFGVRNSGVHAVVEGVGDHGCEYMTGGAVAVLGETGRNFAAGMSGGVAYVYDPDDQFRDRVNGDGVTLGAMDERDERLLRRLLENHVAYTDSDRAEALLADWPATVESFVRVVPDAYARAVAEGADDVRESPPAPAEESVEATVADTTADD